jgi:hypothetical protein
MIKCTLPWVPPRANLLIRGHWTVEYRAMQTAAAYLLAAIGKGTPARRRVTIKMYRWNCLDPDNRQFTAQKPILDALVRLGWLPGDRDRDCEVEVLPVEIDRRHQRTEITLEDL